MAFDASLNKVLDSEVIEGDTTSIEVSLNSYNEGAPKIQLSRFSTDEEGERRYRKLGRLSYQEAEEVFDALGRILSENPAS